MKAEHIRMNGTYRMKHSAYRGCVQADGSPFTSPVVTIVRIKCKAGRKSLWYFDSKGNAFRSSDLDSLDVVPVEL
jgi:hypothetical protein